MLEAMAEARSSKAMARSFGQTRARCLMVQRTFSPKHLMVSSTPRTGMETSHRTLDTVTVGQGRLRRWSTCPKISLVATITYKQSVGQVTFLDNTYTKAYVVCVQDSSIIRAPGTTNTTDCQSDLHEARMTSRGTLLTTGRTLVQHDLTYLGGPAGAWVQDSVFYEVDIATSQVLFRWR